MSERLVTISNPFEVRVDELLEEIPGKPNEYRRLGKPPVVDQIVYVPGTGEATVDLVAEGADLCVVLIGRSEPSGQDSEGDDGEE